jgi:2-iminobutanoate/2-iminopropanoate deaminase
MSVARREEVTVPSLRPPLGHYAHAVRFGNLLFVTGCTGVTADGQLVADDVVEQTRQVFRNLQAILAAAGASFSDVLKVTTYLTDVSDQPLINPVRQEVFGQTRPASTLVQISALAVPGAKVEIDLVAGLTPD